MTDQEATSFLREMSTITLFQGGVWSQIGISETESGVLVGDIGLFLSIDQKHAEIGFTLQRESQGKGIATIAVREAINLVFECPEAKEVRAVTDARNLSSIRLLERAGMQRLKSTEALFRGEHCIEHTYAIARRE